MEQQELLQNTQPTSIVVAIGAESFNSVGD